METRISSVISTTENEILGLPRNVHQENVISDNLEYVKDLAKRDIPTLIINEILDDDNLLQTIAGRSYEHVNHFDKIVIVDNPDPKGFRLTLHSWNGNYGEEIAKEELIHNHRFSFWSHVFRGRLVSENFVESPLFSVEKKNFNKYVYRPSKTGNIHSCTFDKESQLTKLDNIYVDKGETYYLSFTTTHRVMLPKNGNKLCTFVLRDPREREYTNTYNTFYPDRGITSNVPMMTPIQLREKLLRILGE